MSIYAPLDEVLRYVILNLRHNFIYHTVIAALGHGVNEKPAVFVARWGRHGDPVQTT